MLTEVKAYSSWPSAPTLLLSDTGRAETDLIQVRDIKGLSPVKASVNTSPFGAVDGAAFVGSSVLSRNIVLTVRPNPDWDDWSYESLRKLLYSYFMPKRLVRLVFESDDLVPVEIYGYVEDFSDNIFSSDPEYLISIICPDPYFTSVDPVILTGQAIREGGGVTDIDYDGNLETGIYVKLNYTSGSEPTFIGIQSGDSAQNSVFWVIASVSSTKYFEINSVPRQKFVELVDLDNGVITNLLSNVEEGAIWPYFQPGANHFSVITDVGVQDWELRYYARFGGL